MSETTYTMPETNAAKFSGPFTVTYKYADGTNGRKDCTWTRLQRVLPMLGRMADRERIHSLAVTDRHGIDQTFSSDVLPLLEDVTVIPA